MYVCPTKAVSIGRASKYQILNRMVFYSYFISFNPLKDANR